MQGLRDDALWNGERGSGGISWAERSRMGPLRGVIDAADESGRRNLYMHTLHLRVLKRELQRAGAIRRALDFGCGTGRFIAALAAHCAEVVATDKEPAMIDAARRYAAGSDARIESCDSEHLAMPSAYFDFVLCSSVLCVTPGSRIEPMVQELARVTRPGGTLLLLDQVFEARSLEASRYYDALRKSGFTVARAYPIRSATSRFTSLVTRHAWIPDEGFRALSEIELFATRRLPRRRGYAYLEYAIAARRR